MPTAKGGAPPEDEQVLLETCRGPEFLMGCMKSASRWFHCTDIPWGTVNKTIITNAIYKHGDIAKTSDYIKQI
jgi:hypothetical protein